MYGGTSAGVAAAVEAKRLGRTVVVVSPDQHLGGLSSGGLGFTDTGDKPVIGGVAHEFYHRVWRHYQGDAAWRWQKRSEFGNRGQGTAAIDASLRTMWVFEPHVAEGVFEGLVAEHGVTVVRGEWLDRGPGGVVQGDGRIELIRTLSGALYRGKVFVDATYEGDLMAAAGVAYHVGREPASQYDEEWNGVQQGVVHHHHYFPTPVDPYVVPGDPASGLVAGVSSDPPGQRGDGDRRVQAYCFRMCLSNHPYNRLPFAKPDGYDPADYELLARVLATGWREVFAKFDAIPNRKTDTNNTGPVSTDHIGANYDYPEASYDRRREIVADHERYQKGLMYFLANDPRVPEGIRAEMAAWGLAADEFRDNGGWPHQLYVREARRMVGSYVMTEHECLSRHVTPEPIGMGSYALDSHNVQRYVTPEGTVQNEGDVGVPPPGPYAIAYGSIVPRRGEAGNLLVPVCVSSSHIAYGSIRMEPVFMVLGQSAAVAADLAIELGVAVQDVPYAELAKRLRERGQVLAKPE
ncbi:MAG: FAD-dependent oxidoreductase [Lacipirellulaceae bacterium]